MDPQEKRERLYWAVGRLPSSCRHVAVLHYRNEPSPKQIEEMLELPRGEARRQLKEADALLPELIRLNTTAALHWSVLGRYARQRGAAADAR